MIPTRVNALIDAMQVVEGWHVPAPGNAWRGSRAWRNKNPLNLRFSKYQAGTIDGFAFFIDDMTGRQAAASDIIAKCKGNTRTGLTGKSTLRDLIRVWAPESDGNNPVSYLSTVCRHTGFAPDMKLEELLK